MDYGDVYVLPLHSDLHPPDVHRLPDSIRHFSIHFLRMTAIPSWCWLLSLPVYSNFSAVLVLYLPDPNSKNVQIIVYHLCCNLYQLSCLIHRPIVSESNSGLGFGADDFHPPVSGFLSAFTTVVHTSIFPCLWKPITPSSVDFLCYRFRNIGVLPE